MDYEDLIPKRDLEFGISLMNHLSKAEPGSNVSISPISIRTVLSMIYEGAEMDSYSAIDLEKLAGIPEHYVHRKQGFGRVLRSLNSSDDSPYDLRCANGMWVAERYPIRNNFKDVMREDYKAEIQSADFSGNPNAAVKRINNWIKENTNGKIKNVMDKNSIDSLTRIILANALYFKAPWENRFSPKLTSKETFNLSNGEKIKVDMMKKRDKEFLYGEGFNFFGAQAVLIPYEGGKLANLMLLPNEQDDLNSLESDIAQNNIGVSDLTRGLRKWDIDRLEIPKHEFKGNYDLVAPLKNMGIKGIFEKDEITNISPEPLHVSDIAHSTYTKTNEQGSEGAAATVAKISFRCAISEGPEKKINFIANRPYLEMIIDQDTKTCLFLNRIENPLEK